MKKYQSKLEEEIEVLQIKMEEQEKLHKKQLENLENELDQIKDWLKDIGEATLAEEANKQLKR